MALPDSSRTASSPEYVPYDERRYHSFALRVTGTYLITGILWIVMSDLSLATSGGVTSIGFMVGAAKGCLFVFLSAALVYWLCLREYRAMIRATDLLRAIVEGTSDGIFVKDLHGRYLLINASGATAIGSTVDEVVGHDDRELFDAPEAEPLIENDRAIMTSGKAVTFEETITTDGGTRTFQVTKTALLDKRRSVIGLIGISRDISEHKEIELALRETESRLREAQRIARLGSWTWEPPTNRVWWSDAEFELFGADPNKVVPGLDAFLSMLHPDERPVALARVDDMLASANEFANDLRVVRADGSIMWIHSQARATRDASGKLLRVEGIDQDITEQRLVQEAARESERRLQTAVEVAGLGVVTFDYQQQTAELSPRAAEQFGFTDQLVVSRDELHSRFHPQERDELLALIDQALDPTGLGCFAKEHRVVWPDGTVRWLNVRKQISFAEGKPHHSVLVAADVTDQKEAEAKLREQEMLVREAAELAKVGGWGFDPVTMKSDWTPEVALMYGLAHDSPPPADKALEFYSPAQRPRLEAALTAALSEGKPHDLELQLHAADGQVRWVRTICRPIVEAGRVVRVRGSLQDITDRKREESERERSAALLRSVLDSVSDSILTMDTGGIITSANRATQVLFGYTTDELLGNNARTLMPDSQRQQPDRNLIDHDTSQISLALGVTRECVGRRKDGSMFPAELTVTEFARDGKIEFTAVVRDVTARRQLEEQFRQAQKMEAVGRLAGGVAHDFNNLLTVINGYSELLLAELAADNSARSALAAIHDAGDRAARLTEQLLAFSRKSMVEPCLLDVNELVIESAKLFRRLIGEDIALSVVTNPSPVRVMMNPGQLEQVLMNLAVNARDAMPTGGRLAIETRMIELDRSIDRMHPDLPSGRYASLQVTDTGCGMTTEVKDKIFEPFFTTKVVGKGTGLGLAVVHGIIQQAGGAIDVQSEPSAGTSFHILLPAANEMETDAALIESPVAPRGTETVLVVEDEDAVRRLVQVALEGQGYTVITASGGNEVHNLLSTNPGGVDLLLTDVVMPEISGRELALSLRALQPGLRILYMSGYTDDALDRHGLQDNPDQFILKPFTPLALARRVREILDQK